MFPRTVQGSVVLSVEKGLRNAETENKRQIGCFKVTVLVRMEQ
jgi:hypothetical protein